LPAGVTITATDLNGPMIALVDCNG
jgi:hypothetical protein